MKIKYGNFCRAAILAACSASQSLSFGAETVAEYSPGQLLPLFGVGGGTFRAGQTFLATSSGKLTEIAVVLSENGSHPATIFMEFRSTHEGVPGSVLATASIPGSGLSAAPAFFSFNFSAMNLMISAGVEYAFTLRTSASGGISLRGDLVNGYLDGAAYVSMDSGATWTHPGSPNDYDIGFKVTAANEEPSLVVTTTADTAANDGQTSLREAIAYANSLAGPKTISFNIPMTDTGYSGGVFTIRPTQALPAITSPNTTVDGATQTAFSGDTNPQGPEIVIHGELAIQNDIYADGLVLQANGCAVNHLVLNGFKRTDNGAGQSNSGIEIRGSNCRVTGCYLGIDADGNAAVPNWFGIWVAGANGNVIGGTNPGEGNVISGNHSVQLFLVSSDENIIQGNIIGANAAGAAFGGGNGYGIDADSGSDRNLIGGTQPGAGNLISGIGSAGIALRSESADNRVFGNLIGVAADGVSPLGNGFGLVVDYGASRNQIGGVSAGEANRIAFSAFDAVLVVSPATGNVIRGNQIYNNGGLGINLWDIGDNASGVTSNDPCDGDTGSNDLQNHPILSAAAAENSEVNVTGELESRANIQLVVDFYVSPQPDASGHGEGGRYAGSTTIATDGACRASFSVFLPGISAGEYITATATDTESGSTSEFSPALIVSSGGGGSQCLTLSFAGFLPPIGGADSTGGSFANPVRTFKLGSTIPIKFAAACNGSPVTTGMHRLHVIKYSDATTYGDPIDATPQDAATTGDQFRLTGEGHWQFNLDTKATVMSKGVWLIRATLSDQTQHTAWIQLK